VVITKVEKDNKEELEMKDERIIYAEGYGFSEILTMDGVDAKKTKTNHIDETYRVTYILNGRCWELKPLGSGSFKKYSTP
jgi:DNA-directed RNA polymerase beta' subunit